MVHPYPPHHDDLPYVGRRHYFLTFGTDHQARFFVQPSKVELVLSQFLRAGSEGQFALTAYCFMPDHVHLIASGLAEDADGKKFIARGKQYSGSISNGSSASRCGSGMASNVSFATTWNWRAPLATLSPTPCGQDWSAIQRCIRISAHPSTRSLIC
jgi:REP element-mobilizing transposase RayT